MVEVRGSYKKARENKKTQGRYDVTITTSTKEEDDAAMEIIATLKERILERANFYKTGDVGC